MDLAIIEFPEDTFTEWTEIYEGTPYQGQDISIVGCGNTGTASSNLPVWNATASSSGVRRAGKNVISLVESPTQYTAATIWFDFDDEAGTWDYYGDGGAVDDEVCITNFDSGGPTFAYQDSQWKVVSIHVSKRGPIGFSNDTDGYGARGIDVGLFPYTSWISEVAGSSSTRFRCYSLLSLLEKMYGAHYINVTK